MERKHLQLIQFAAAIFVTCLVIVSRTYFCYSFQLDEIDSSVGTKIASYRHSPTLKVRLNFSDSVCKANVSAQGQNACRSTVAKSICDAYFNEYLGQIQDIQTHWQDYRLNIHIIKKLRFQLHILQQVGRKPSKIDNSIHVCETGFKSGESSLLWLLFDNRVHVTAFGNVGDNSRARYLKERFQERFQIVLGSSSTAIYHFRKSHPDFRCDLILIEGAHDISAAASQLSNAIAMSYSREDHRAEKQSHIVLDDANITVVKKVWEEAKAQNLLIEMQIGADVVALVSQVVQSFKFISIPREHNKVYGAASNLVYGIVDQMKAGSIRSSFLNLGESFSYPIYMNNKVLSMCIKVEESLESLNAQAYTFFERHHFEESSLVANSKLVATDIQRFIEGYPLRRNTIKRIEGCPNPEKEPKPLVETLPTFAVAAQFKDEAFTMKEWLDHYLDEGCSHFFLINNNSTDNYLSILEPYIQKGLVTLFSNPKRQQQINNLNRYVLPFAHLYKFFME